VDSIGEIGKYRNPFELVEVQCHSCGNKITVMRMGLREKMYCTIGCMTKKENFNT
jgi:predicted metal-binding membrane protein